jgi:clan AA aspartic protease
VISGIVTERHAIISLTSLLVNGSTFPIEFVVDTGFTDHRYLPPEAVNLLRLPFLYSQPVNLADNTTVFLAVHQATILWDRMARDIRVFATGRRPLLGTALLSQQELVIQFTEGGLVTIDEL